MSMQATKRLFSGVWTVGVVAATAGAGAIAYSRYGINHNVPMPPVLEAEQKWFTSARAGRLSYYADETGSGRPIVLIHSINAAPSAHEIKPLFRYFQGRRPVYALDLPGFGFSERGERPYTPELYAAAITDLLRLIGGEPADLIALSLGSEFAAYVARDNPELVRSLVLISPTGLGPREIRLPSDRIYKVVAFPLWGQALFDLLTSRSLIRYYVAQSFVGLPPQNFMDYAYATSHQPGARFAPFKFLSGRLFTADIRTAVYQTLQRPTLVIYDQDPNVSFDKLPDLLEQNSHWRATRIVPSRGLPHWEKLVETKTVIEEFWGGFEG
jgi:pimeloyl-ACP methyl ester carboxylesterase